MKKPSRKLQRKTKPRHSDGPYHAGPDERASQTHRRAEQREGKREGSGQNRGASRGKTFSSPRRPPRLSREVAVLYEDDAVIVLNKPAGLLAVPIKGSDVPSALSLLIAELKPKRQRALIVHRIDRFASGILLFAKTDRDRDTLIRQFLAHTPVRKYLAVVRGRLKARIRHAGPLFPA